MAAPTEINAASLGEVNAILNGHANADGTLKTAPVQAALGDLRTSAKYILVSDGTTVTTYDAHGTVVGTPGNDFGAALTAVLPAAGGVGYIIALRNDGNVFPNRSTVFLPKNLTGKLLIQHNGAIVQAVASAGRRLYDFNRTGGATSASGDYEAFQNTEITDPIFDRNNFTAAAHESVLLGNKVNGDWSYRLNFSNIILRRAKTLNVPTGGAAIVYENVSICSRHTASNEATQTTIKDLLFEDCDFMQGGNLGIFVGGGGQSVTGQGVNVFIDRITRIRCKHDTLVVPTTTTSSGGYQLGGYAQVGTARSFFCYSANGQDVGDEIDNCQDYLDVGSVWVDSWNAKIFVRNFRPPLDVKTQRNVFIAPTTRNIALDRANVNSRDIAIGGDGTQSGYDFGELVVRDWESLDTITTTLWTRGCNLDAMFDTTASGIKYRKLTVQGKVSYTALNLTTGGNTAVPVDVRSRTAGAEYDLDITISLAGVRSGVGNNQWKLARICGDDAAVRRAIISLDTSGLSGMSAGSDTFYMIGVALDFTSTLRLDQLTPRVIGASSGAPYGVFTAATLTISGTRGFIEKMDMARAPGAGFDVSYGAAAHKNALVIRNTISQRASGGSGPNTAPQGLTGLTTAVGATIGSVTQGQAAVVEFSPGSGAGITAIDYSTNGGTTYTNVLTQVAAAMPAGPTQIRIGPLPPDALIKVTFTTTQPTITLVPTNT